MPEAAALPSGKVMSAHRVIAAPLCALRFLLGLLFLFWGGFFFLVLVWFFSYLSEKQPFLLQKFPLKLL